MSTNLNLIFDTETTGIDRHNDHLVQLAWILADMDENIVAEGCYVVKPEGYKIPREASKIHGITTRHAKLYGSDLADILQEFSTAAEKAMNIIAHNLKFDFAILQTAYEKAGLKFPLYRKTQFDTMHLSTKWCRLPKAKGQRGYKWPKLEELYYLLFGTSFDAHDAMADTKACMKSFFALVDLGVIHMPENYSTRQEKRRRATTYQQDEALQDRLSLSFFKRLFTPKEEIAFIDGLREFAAGNDQVALRKLQRATHLPDAAWIAGILCMRFDKLDQAERLLKTALDGVRSLGLLCDKYGISITPRLRITAEVNAYLSPDLPSILLALAEVYRLRGDDHAAIASVRKLLTHEPGDIFAIVSLAELLLSQPNFGRQQAKEVMHLTEGIGNDTPVHTAALLYKGRALRAAGLHEAAGKVLTEALRRKKDRAIELLRQIRYERALAYEAAGKYKRARNDLENIYADAPSFEDVAKRLEI